MREQPTIHPRFAERAVEPRYGFAEAASLTRRPAQTLRRWALGNRRRYLDHHRTDDPLIAIDGSLADGLPLSFLNLLELRFLSSYRSSVPLPAIRRALDYAGEQLGVERPLLRSDFAARGRELFLSFAEGSDKAYLNASRQGQVAWPEDATAFLESLDYDGDERAAFRWWPLGKDAPVMLDTRLNAGHPSTATTGVRTGIIAARVSRGWSAEAIAEDVTTTVEEIRAAVALESAA
ncbi:MAG: hypothetical protein ACR2NV_07300 [Thermoleophilaceae bacterium]